MSGYLRTLATDIRAMPRGIWVLVGGQFINRFGSFVGPFLALFLQQEGFALGQVTLVLGAISAGGLAAPTVGGYLSDAIGRRNTILISLVGGAITLLGLYAAKTLPALVAVSVLHGFFAYLFGPAANALLTDLVTPEQRVTAYALLRLAINGGFAMGPAVAGMLYARSPLLIFLGDAGTTLVFAALAWLHLPHGLRTITGPAISPAVAWRSWLEAAGDAARNGPFLQMLVGLSLMALAFVQVFNVLALHATARGLDPFHYGLVMGMNGLVILGCELPLSHAMKSFPPRRTLALGFLVTGLGCAAFAWAQTLGDFLRAMALFTAGEMLTLPVASAYSARLSPVAYRGRYFGFHAQVWSVAGVAGSAGVWCYGRLGAPWWLLSGACGAAAALVMALRFRDRRPGAA